jgi:heme exporter protein CcmD
MSDFFYMGGFGAYIWSAMGAAAFLMLLEPILLVMKRRAIIKDIVKMKRLDERRSRKTR